MGEGGQNIQISSYKLSHKDTIYSMVTIVDVLHIFKLLREILKSSSKGKYFCNHMWQITTVSAVIISEHIVSCHIPKTNHLCVNSTFI